MHIACSNISPIVIFSRKSNTNAIADPYCALDLGRAAIFWLCGPQGGVEQVRNSRGDDGIGPVVY